ncbi:MAG: hypothetical protein SGI83_13525 [Bacteroidota bacterium]|nr:hypothetical protein [Bacteroidota bacterium]
MKKIFLALSMLFTTIFVNAQRNTYPAGWISINLNDFMCNKATQDDLLNFDGFGDEVYFVIFYSVANQFGVTKYSNKLVSKIYGDTYRFPNRVLAGGANPDNKGGMLSGNQFFPGAEFPNLNKIRVEAGDFITVIPTIWEWDNSSNSQVQANFESRVINSFNVLNLKIVDLIRECFGYYQCFQMTNPSVINFPAFRDMLSPLNNAVGSRPIGMMASGEFSPVIFAINSEMIKSQHVGISTDGKNYSMNYISFNINEESLGNTQGHGIYRLRYHFSFEEDKSVPSPPPPAPIKGKVMPGKIKTLPGSISIQTVFSIIGKWSGIQTNDYGQFPQAISFDLTDNGEYLIKDVNGVLAAKGSYNFSNNVINGSYKLLSSGETISFTGTYDPGTQKLSCTLGTGTSTTGQGKWVGVKK